MNKSELAPLVDSLIPGFYNFAYSLIPDELQSEQLVVDAYSVFLVRERDFLEESEYDASKRPKFKKYIQNQMIIDILDLGAKRSAHLKSLIRGEREFKSFYQLELNQRAALSLKEHLKLGVQDLQEIFGFKKYQIVELLHNARAALTDASSRAGQTPGGLEELR
ncbi:MAG: hypothetical protein WEB87_04545 [Bacteriovoracaceae bacterium]